MKLRPVGDHIIVREVSREEASPSGIILPETLSKERPEKGEVIAVGPGKLLKDGSRSSMEVSVGDVVVFKKYAPDEVKDGNTTYLVIRADDVMAIVE